MLLPPPEAPSSQGTAVRYHHVKVRIEDGHVVTRVEQEFYNPHDVPVTSRYIFPIPPEAILSRFEVMVDGRYQDVARQDAEATTAELYAIIGQQRDPSLLQYTGWESLTFDLSLPPGGSRQMTLEYEEILAPSGGLYRYRYVLSTERYSAQPLEEVSIQVDVYSSAGLSSLYSSSHEVAVSRSAGGRAHVSWGAEGIVPDEDFYLFYAPAEAGYGGGLLTGERDGHGHLLFLFSPEAGRTSADTLPKDIVFVMDRSGSMEGEKIEQARRALYHILGQLGEEDRFSIVSFDERISLLDPVLRPVGEGTLGEARRYVDRLSADGSTDLEAALQSGLAILERSESRDATRMVVFLTDGLPTAGITKEALIARLVRETNARLEARLHIFGVGYDVNTHLLDGLAADNGGSVTYVRPGEDLEMAMTGFYEKIAHPLLTDLEVEFEGLEAGDLYPETLPDLFQGSSLMLTGRYGPETAGESVSVRVRGWAGAERREYVYHYDLQEAGGHDFVSRLWATRRIGALLDRVRVEGTDAELEDEIRELGLNYGIVTPYTAFVINGQAEGAASEANMALYVLQELNQSSGRVTIEARVQNQTYQQAAQANLAIGGNVVNYGQRSLAQVGAQQVDLGLFEGWDDLEAASPEEWLERYVEVDRIVEFGTKEYFALAEDPEIRSYLQSGLNVVFDHQGKVIEVRDPEQPNHEPGDVGLKPGGQGSFSAPSGKGMQSMNLVTHAVAGLPELAVRLVPALVAAALMGLMGLFALVVVVAYHFSGP
jgi:Ca-activated chloride channel family protein